MNRKIFKTKIFIGFTLFLIILIVCLIAQTSDQSKLSQLKNHLAKSPKFRNWFVESKSEALLKNFGENGSDVFLTDPREIELNEKLYQETGFSQVVSDKISVNRSLPNVVHPNCSKFEYYANLPSVSVVIIFHNEVMSVLLRTIHSVINRTPPQLLHEIILVNDCSKNLDLYDPLKKYATDNFPRKVKIRNLKSRNGLIRTRLAGARMATGEVLVASCSTKKPKFCLFNFFFLVFRFARGSSAELAASSTSTIGR